MRKNRGWSSTEIITQPKLQKPTGLIFNLNGCNLSLKWTPIIGCFTNYIIYGANNAEQLEKIGETFNNYFSQILPQTNESYFIAVSTYYDGIESEKSEIFQVKTKVEKPVEVIKVIPEPIITPLQPEVLEIRNPSILPFGLCACCLVPQPLMKRKEKVVCSKNLDQEYEYDNIKWNKKAKLILSDIEKIDELLRQNSAYVGVNGIILK